MFSLDFRERPVVAAAARAVPWPEFSEEVEALYAPPMRERSTAKAIRRVLRELGEVGAVTTADLTAGLIARWVQAQHARGRARATIRGYLGKARAICSIACGCGYLDRTPFAIRREWIRADPQPAPKRHLSLDQVAQLLGHLRGLAAVDWFGHRLYALASLVALTGVRTAEALHARVEDVDFAERVFVVSGRRRLKTAGSAAPVPMPDPLPQVLACWSVRTGCEWLFPGERRAGPWTGGPPGKRPVDRLKAEALKLGIAGVTFLALRHSWATHGETAWGLAEGEIQRVLRHTTPLTQRGYRHADLANLRRIGDRVGYGVGRSVGPDGGSGGPPSGREGVAS